MQSFDTEKDDTAQSAAPRQSFVVGGIADLRPGACLKFELPGGDELAVCNVDGEYYAIDNFCPHKGAPLSDGTICGHILECGLHGRGLGEGRIGIGPIGLIGHIRPIKISRAVVADCFHRTAAHRFITKRLFFLSLRLLVNERVAVLV